LSHMYSLQTVTSFLRSILVLSSHPYYGFYPSSFVATIL
jgi:hypothetical protein